MDTSEYDKGVEGVSKSGSGLASKLKSGLATAGSLAAKGIGLIAGAAGAAGGALLALEASTEEYRVAQGKLGAAYEAAGMDISDAQYAYEEFYKVLGDTDTATEASQLLAQLATNGEDIAYWTHIAAGVAGTFGDSLPIESLIEASNETAKVGTVTGALADALNWVGISEDEFNEKLAACSDEAERGELIMNTLIDTYDGAADAFNRNNEELIRARENQVLLNDSLAVLGESVSKVKNNLYDQFVPALSGVTTALAHMLDGSRNASGEFSRAIQKFIDQAVSKLPEFMAFGSQILVSLAGGIVQSIPALVESLPEMLTGVGEAIQGLAPIFMEMGPQLLSALGEGIMAGIPVLATTAVSLLTNFGAYIRENLPALLQTGLEFVSSFTASIRENAGLMVDGALSLLESLAQGIADGLPALIENIPQIVSNIANVINDNAPKVLESALNIIVTLGNGLIDAIPTLIANIPQIIMAIVDAFLAFNWLNLGKSIIKGLGNGLKSMKQFVKDIASQVADAVKNGISALPGEMLQIGKNIIQGLWNGISGAVGWLKGKIGDVIGGIVGIAEDLLGINSPSRVFAGIGENMALGLGEGWGDEYSRIKKDIENGMTFDPVPVTVNGRQSNNGHGYGGSLQVHVTVQSGVVSQTADAQYLGRVIGERTAREIRSRGGAVIG